MAHAEFPHETTTDQWFSESQFESYRALGFEITDDLLNSVINSKMPGTPPPAPLQTLEQILGGLLAKAT